MTKVIIMPDSNLDGFYEQTLQYLQEKYHNETPRFSGRLKSDRTGGSSNGVGSHYNARNRNNRSSQHPGKTVY